MTTTSTSSTVFTTDIEALAKLIAERDAEIARLKILLTRASDALEARMGWPPALIAELRKAT